MIILNFLNSIGNTLLGYFLDVLKFLLPSGDFFDSQIEVALHTILPYATVWGVIIPFDTIFLIISYVIAFEGAVLFLKFSLYTYTNLIRLK